MADRKNDGGPAFPFDIKQHGGRLINEGMTLRDWFAGQALAGICAHSETWGLHDVQTVGRQAYRIADAMMEARNG